MKKVYAVCNGRCMPYLTVGKPYLVVQESTPKGMFSLIDDEGNELLCLWKDCEHLVGGNWKRIVK